MAYVFHTTAKLNDRQIVKLMNDLSDSIGEKPVYLYGTLTISASEIENFVKRSNRHSISQANLDGGQHAMRVFYYRGLSGLNHDRQTSPNIRVPSPYFDEVVVYLPDNNRNKKQATPDIIRQVEVIIDKHCSKPLATPSANEETIQSTLLAEINKISSLHQSMMEDAERIRRESEQYRQDTQEKLNEQRIELETEHAKLVASEEQRIRSLEKKVEDSKKALDDRNHMHVRRELREKITNKIGADLEKGIVPQKLKITEVFITALSLLAAVISAYFASSALSAVEALLGMSAEDSARFSGFDTILYMEFARATIASIATIAFILYTIGWLKKNYQNTLQSIHDRTRYSMDIDRASWVIETIMEMTSIQGRVLPEKWIEGACNGLFRSSEDEGKEISSMDAWTALLSNSAKLQHSPDGTSIELGKRDIKKVIGTKEK